MKYFLYLLLIITTTSCMNTRTLYIGTYTNNNQSKGIYVYNFNEKKGTLEAAGASENIENPSYLAHGKNNSFLYAVNESVDGKGQVSAIQILSKNKELQILNSQPSHGDAPCHIAIDHTGKFAVVANYVGGNFSVYPIAANGNLGEAVAVVQHTKNGDPKAAHAHFSKFSPDNKYLFVCDLGADALFQYAFDANATNPITPFKTYAVPQGSGPRHSIFSPNGKFLYLLNEWKANIIVYAFDGTTLSPIQTISSSEIEGPEGNRGSAAIRVSPDGKFLYVSNRGNTNNIAIYSIAENGILTRVGEQATDLHPRDFVISPNGKWLLVAARDSNSVKVYRRDTKTGLLNYHGIGLSFPSPVALLF